MVLTCPACKARYRINPAASKSTLARVKCPGCENVFEVSLVEENEVQKGPTESRKPVVLVVDEARFFREMIKDILKDLPVSLEMAADGNEAVERALAVNAPDPTDALDVLAKVGGFEIGGIAGVILAAAANRIPVVIDGFISTAGAMLAVGLAPQAKPYIISAHRSQENGHQRMLRWLGLDPLLSLEMRLGEGTGAALAISLAEAACKVLGEMATFAEAGVSGKESE